MNPIIERPSNSQNYNRYSYCLNNPLKYTDPSGYNYSCYIDGLQVSERNARRYLTSNWDNIDLNFHSTRGGSSGINNQKYSSTYQSDVQRDVINSKLHMSSEYGVAPVVNRYKETGVITNFWTYSDNESSYYYIGMPEEITFEDYYIRGTVYESSTSRIENYFLDMMTIHRELFYENYESSNYAAYSLATIGTIADIMRKKILPYFQNSNLDILLAAEKNGMPTTRINSIFTNTAKLQKFAKTASKYAFFAGELLSVYDGVMAYTNGDMNGTKIAALDIVVGYVAYGIGGIRGFAIFGAYMMMKQGPGGSGYSNPSFYLRDNTNVNYIRY